MRWGIPVWILMLLLACGGDPPAQVSPSGASQSVTGAKNQPPVIMGVSILPEHPTSADELKVSVRASDPERDSLRVEVEWFRNGRSQGRGTATRFSSSQTSRKDKLYAVAYVSDGTSEVSAPSVPVRIENQLPSVTSVTIHPERVTTKDELVATAEAGDPDGDPIEFDYQWFVNGEQLEGTGGPNLESGRVKRGDVVAVSVAASDREGEGRRQASRPVRVQNAPPDIKSSPTYDLVGENMYRYQIRAEDPDGDRPLRYKMVEGPKGMRVDLVSGVVSWTVPTDGSGVYPVELSVSDPHGGEMRQSYSLELSWEVPPASTP